MPNPYVKRIRKPSTAPGEQYSGEPKQFKAPSTSRWGGKVSVAVSNQGKKVRDDEDEQHRLEHTEPIQRDTPTLEHTPSHMELDLLENPTQEHKTETKRQTVRRHQDRSHFNSLFEELLKELNVDPLLYNTRDQRMLSAIKTVKRLNAEFSNRYCIQFSPEEFDRLTLANISLSEAKIIVLDTLSRSQNATYHPTNHTVDTIVQSMQRMPT
mmetsp:Transcript_28047/g.47016  ORF Transcript_28047/g.47016 Transcript_28047/m.47016 type:complete len:211 (-) Transcript_28047:76-708(-)